LPFVLTSEPTLRAPAASPAEETARHAWPLWLL
jgi:hypothetical protein